MIVYWQAEWRAGCAAVPAAPGRHPGRPVTQLRLERSEDDAPLCHWWDFFLTFLVRDFVSHLIYGNITSDILSIEFGTVHTDRFCLKVPKCEIFDRSDFHDFYTVKSS